MGDLVAAGLIIFGVEKSISFPDGFVVFCTILLESMSAKGTRRSLPLTSTLTVTCRPSATWATVVTGRDLNAIGAASTKVRPAPRSLNAWRSCPIRLDYIHRRDGYTYATFLSLQVVGNSIISPSLAKSIEERDELEKNAFLRCYNKFTSLGGALSVRSNSSRRNFNYK